ncbi:hypothetical protein [Salipaludibacillus agaradhaerens]|uniref:hypothetical protein n=1 Tax=Salipaludibacillus agaradhaerens TaxID=76935 RepID=UPI00215072DB|nr:hypothetical protein [Salipaludibacillus agaradhaerens]
MAAQFEDELVPDKNCSNYRIDIENGVYKAEIIQFYNVDKNEYFGSNDADVLINFIKENEFQQVVDNVLWCTY